ncbi:uncharacterized protein FFB14_02099 [Fusarium fujikuroi]|nr:uncharacterized protein FFB14_02099 [Fusarium fujikuroi]
MIAVVYAHKRRYTHKDLRYLRKRRFMVDADAVALVVAPGFGSHSESLETKEPRAISPVFVRPE